MEAENNLIDNIHFRPIRKSTDHMSKYYQKNQQCFYIVKMIISLSSYAYSPLFILMYSRNSSFKRFREYITYPVVSIPSFYKNRKQVQEVSPASEFTFLSPYIYPFLKQVQEVSPASAFTFLSPYVYPFLKQVQEVSPASGLC